jgi:hypothetical protein
MDVEVPHAHLAEVARVILVEVNSKQLTKIIMNSLITNWSFRVAKERTRTAPFRFGG